MPTKKELENQLKCAIDVVDQGEEFLQVFLKEGLTFEKIDCIGCRITRICDFFRGQVKSLLDDNEKLKEEIEQLKSLDE